VAEPTLSAHLLILAHQRLDGVGAGSRSGFQYIQRGRCHHRPRSGQSLQGTEQALARWQAVTFIMRSPSAPEMKLLLQKITKWPEGEVSGLIVTSNPRTPQPPRDLVVSSDEDLVKRSRPSPSNRRCGCLFHHSSVAVVKIAGKLPLEPGYLLLRQLDTRGSAQWLVNPQVSTEH